MRSFLRATLMLFAITALPILLTAQEDPKPAAEAQKNYLELAAKAVGGEWVDEKGIKDPDAPHGRFTSEWGVGKKLLRSKTFWVNKRQATQIYEGSSWWHPGRKEVAFFEMAVSGELYEGSIEEKEGKSIARWKAYSEKGVTEYEQHGKYLDDDTMESTVYIKKEGKLEALHSFKFHRKPLGWGLGKESPPAKD